VTIQKAVEKTGYADYWALRRLGALPKETENYVPIFLGTAFVAKNPAAFGLDAQPAPPLHPDQVRVGAPTDLRLVAQLIDRPVEEIIDANPSLLRWTTPANNPQFVLSLPPDTKELYDERIASIPVAKRVWWRAHKVEEGETLSSLARKYHVSRVALAEANQLSGDGPIAPGAHLVLPMLAGKESSLARMRQRGPLRLVRYFVKAGDTLELVADRFDVTPYQIRRWNGLKTSGLSAGKTLRLYVRGVAASSRPAGHARHHPRPQSSPSKAKSPAQLSPAATGTAASNSSASC
jgi:membrane-bound lytic murein transglycosylase D